MLNNIMVDCETLGTSADATIISIGAVRFDLETEKIDDDAFYASITIDSNLAAGRRINEDTLKWWMKQDITAQQVFFEPKSFLFEALIAFKTWIGKEDHLMWSNGADFDLPMLAHAYTQLHLDLPWKFYNNRCFRTYKNLPGAKNIRVTTGTKHNALDDAINQTITLQAIHKKLFL